MNVRVAKEILSSKGPETYWYHLECAKVLFLCIKTNIQFPSIIRDASEISGYSILKPADKKKLEEIIEEIQDSVRKAKKATESFFITPEISAKKQAEDDEKTKVDKLWKLKDKLSMKYTKEELQEILR